MSSDQKGEMIKEVLKDDGVFPNNPLLPLITYKNAVALPGREDAAATLEGIFAINHWGQSWRDGVYDYHHYHSTAHEVLGIYEGHATLQFGGPKGISVHVQKGDVIIIPAGVAHKNLGSSEDFKCVGAYPFGQNYDMNYGKAGERPETDENIKKVPLPVMDPIYGPSGNLVKNWKW